MSFTGKPVMDFFRPLSQMRNGSQHSWSCSIHIVSDSTIVFKDASGRLSRALCLSTTCDTQYSEVYRQLCVEHKSQ
eukprot:6423314-Pyramimonas_sp.AAC.1